MIYVIAIMSNARKKKPTYQYLHEYRYDDKGEALQKVKELSKGNRTKFTVLKLHNKGVD